MKYFQQLTLVVALALFTFSCGGVEGEAVTSDEAVATSSDSDPLAIVYAVDPSTTQVLWMGNKLIGASHQGTIGVQTGNIQFLDGNITGGEIVLDMASLTNQDLEPGNGKEKLEGHLKSDDFFSVETYPTATFSIAKAEPVTGQEGITHRITGNLTLKGQTRSVTIPAKVSVENNVLTASSPQFVIDRTEWGVQYGSGSIAGIAQDNIIKDEVGLQLNVQAIAPAN